MLERWTNYLKPTKERRVHLEDWYKASPSDVSRRSETLSDRLHQRRRRTAKSSGRVENQSRCSSRKRRTAIAASEVHAGGQSVLHRSRAAERVLSRSLKKIRKNFSTEEARAKWNNLKGELKAIKDAAPPEPPFACGVAEGEPVQQHVFLRGNHDSQGDIVPKAFPLILAGDDQQPRSKKEAVASSWQIGLRAPTTHCLLA